MDLRPDKKFKKNNKKTITSNDYKLADLGAQVMHSPSIGQNFFIFMELSEKIGQVVARRPPVNLGCATVVNSVTNTLIHLFIKSQNSQDVIDDNCW